MIFDTSQAFVPQYVFAAATESKTQAVTAPSSCALVSGEKQVTSLNMTSERPGQLLPEVGYASSHVGSSQPPQSALVAEWTLTH